MANVVFNIAKGRVVEYYNRVVANDPANSALILIPMETTGIGSVNIDQDDLATILATAANEQLTMGRKTLTNTELAALPVPNDTSDYYEINLPTVTWTAVAVSNAISAIIVAYDNDTTAGTDSNIIPLTMFDAVATPDGNDLVLQTGAFFRAT